MNKETSRRNVETMVYVAILVGLIAFLVYDTIYHDEQKQHAQKLNTHIDDPLAMAGIESNIVNDSYVIDEESKTINVITNISSKEKLGEFVSEFITDKYFDSNGVGGEFKSIEPFEEDIYVVTITVEADILERSDTQNFVTSNGTLFVFNDSYKLNIKLNETPQSEGPYLTYSEQQKLGQKTFNYLNEVYFKPRGIRGEFKSIEPFEEDLYIVTTKIEGEAIQQNESKNYYTSGGVLFIVKGTINVYEPVVPGKTLFDPPLKESESDGPINISNGTFSFSI